MRAWGPRLRHATASSSPSSPQPRPRPGPRAPSLTHFPFPLSHILYLHSRDISKQLPVSAERIGQPAELETLEDLTERKPFGYWKSLDHQRSFLVALGKRLGIPEGEYEAWYKVKQAQVRSFGGRGLLTANGYSLIKVLQNVFPEHPWDPHRLQKRPQKFWVTTANQRAFMDELAVKFHISGPSEFGKWHNVTAKDIASNGGGRLLRIYGNSLSKLFRAVYPEYPWNDSNFSQKSQNFFKIRSNQKKILLEIGSKLRISENNFEAWYKVPTAAVADRGGGPLLAIFDGSLPKLLVSVFSEHKWDLSKFPFNSRNSLKLSKSFDSQRAFAESIALKLGKSVSADLGLWYEISTSDFLSKGGGELLNKFNQSISKMLKSIYPNHIWDPSKFSSKPKGFWSSSENQRSFLDSVASKLGFPAKEYDRWYQYSNKTILELGGRGLMEQYASSYPLLLKGVYPEHTWDDSLFLRKAAAFWADPKNQRNAVAEIALKLGIKVGDFDKWYSLTSEKLFEHGAGPLVTHYFKGSTAHMITFLFPEHKWDLWRFSNLRGSFAKSNEVQISLIETLREKFGIEKEEDWTRVTNEDLLDQGVLGAVESFGGLQKLLAHVDKK